MISGATGVNSDSMSEPTSQELYTFISSGSSPAATEGRIWASSCSYGSGVSVMVMFGCAVSTASLRLWYAALIGGQSWCHSSSVAGASCSSCAQTRRVPSIPAAAVPSPAAAPAFSRARRDICDAHRRAIGSISGPPLRFHRGRAGGSESVCPTLRRRGLTGLASIGAPRWRVKAGRGGSWRLVALPSGAAPLRVRSARRRRRSTRPCPPPSACAPVRAREA